MKIAVYHNLPSGGGKRALFEYLKRLKRYHEFDLYTLNTSCEDKFLPLNNFLSNKYVYNINLKKNFLNYLKLIYLDLPKIHKKIAFDIEKKNYDLVLVTHDFFTKSPLLINYIKKIPILYLCYEPPREFYEPLQWHISNLKQIIANIFRYPFKNIDFLTVKKADKILTISKYMKKKLMLIYKTKIEEIKAGVDSNYFKYQKIKRKKFFLSVGALVKLKGFDFLIRAISILPKKERFPLYLVGNGGKDEKYFKKIAKKYEVKLVIKKFIKDKELISIYNSAFLFLYAPLEEPLGLVTLEAMACGLPVVGVKEGGLKETINQKVSFLTERDEKKFAQLLFELINNRILIDKLRYKARRYVINNWKWEEGTKKLNNLIISLTKKNDKS